MVVKASMCIGPCFVTGVSLETVNLHASHKYNIKFYSAIKSANTDNKLVSETFHNFTGVLNTG